MNFTTGKNWWQEVMKFFKVFYNKSIFLPKKVLQYTLQLSSLDLYTVMKRKFFLLPKMYVLKLKHATFVWKLLSQLDFKKATSVLISSFLIFFWLGLVTCIKATRFPKYLICRELPQKIPSVGLLFNYTYVFMISWILCRLHFLMKIWAVTI